MSRPQMPYQCMVTCGNILVAARGSRIDSFDVQNGSILSTWTCPASQELAQKSKAAAVEAPKKEETPNPTTPTEAPIQEESSPPAKKRKLSAENVEAKNEEASTSTPDIKPEQQDRKKKQKKQNNRSEAVASGLQAPAVIALAATKDGRHVIAVTGEDKSIRVFESIEEGGSYKLEHISQRAMPKRPCSITITADSQTIISADKFGDVYSLPLIPSPTPSDAPPSDAPPSTSTPPTPDPTTAKPFIPAANELTIHSARNRKALANQKRQTNRPTETPKPTFSHNLLLGHVSMLTDVVLVTVHGRDYIVTADRDEHIRVSRGIPQAHVIEGFCLGHTEFVTRLCFPGTRPDIMISGGGEDELFVWEWLAGRLVGKGDLKRHVDVVRSGLKGFQGNETPVESVKIAVSGLYSVQTVVKDDLTDVIIVTCEGVPALFTFTLSPSKALVHLQTIPLSGNVLSLVTTSPSTNPQLIISLDTIHAPGSTSVLRPETELASPSPTPSLQTFNFQNGILVDGQLAFTESEETKDEDMDSGVLSRLGNLLYGLENLRKREGDVGEE